VPKSRSVQSLQLSFNEDIEHTRKVAEFLTKKLNTKDKLSVSESQLSPEMAIQIRPNKTIIGGKSVSRRNKTPAQLLQIDAHAQIETALIEMQNLSTEGMNNHQKAIAVLSSMGVATPISNIEYAQDLISDSTFFDGVQVHPMKKIELDETIADQEYTKPIPGLTARAKQSSKLSSMSQSQKDYLTRIASRMCELWNFGEAGRPNSYSAFRPSQNISAAAAAKSTSTGGRVIGSARTKFIAARVGGINQKVGILSSAGTSEIDEMMSLSPDRILSSAGTRFAESQENKFAESQENKPISGITSGNTSY
jgi:hypothetical protein